MTTTTDARLQPIPEPIVVYVHTMKALASMTVDLATVLPEIIRDRREVQAAAVMCAASDVRGHFYKARMSITPDRSFIEIAGTRSVDGQNRPGARLFIPLAEIVQVSHFLPVVFGNEAVGNPMCGSRIAIKCVERSVVVYALNTIDREAWFRYVETIAKKHAAAAAPPSEALSAIDRTLRGSNLGTPSSAKQAHADPERRTITLDVPMSVGTADSATTPNDASSIAANPPRQRFMVNRDGRANIGAGPLNLSPAVDVSPSAPTSRAGMLFQIPQSSAIVAGDVPEDAANADLPSMSPFLRVLQDPEYARRRANGEGAMGPAPLGPEFAKWRSLAGPADGGDESMVGEDVSGHGTSDVMRQAGFTARDMAQFTLPPLALDEADPDTAHFEWRYKEMLRVFPKSTPLEDLETARVMQSLKVPGRWCESGQSDPRDENAAVDPMSRKDASSDPNAAAAADPVAEALKLFTGSSGGTRVQTASDRLNAAKPKAAPRAGVPASSHLADASPMPWIEFPWRRPHEAHMMLLLKLAQLKVALERGTETSRTVSIPPDLTAAQVPDFWRGLYTDAVEHVTKCSSTIRTRLGVRRVGVDRAHERAVDESARERIDNHLRR